MTIDLVNITITVIVAAVSALAVSFFWIGQYKHKVDTLEKDI